MRIGSLQNLSFQKYEMSSTRDIIQKHVPNYLQVQNYDLVSHEDTITVSGTLVGSSNANLSTQIEQLKAMHRQKRVIWIDASDQYQDELSLARITKLTGPTIDSSKGPLVASFSLQAESLPPWGTTHANPFNQSGILFRDLDGRLLGNAVNPLDDNCNFTGSPAGGPFTSFSWEFIVDNQNPFTNVTSLKEALGNSAGSSPGSASAPYLTTAVFNPGNSLTTSIDSSTVPNSGYSATAKGTKSSPAASTQYDMEYEFGTSGINISAYDRLRLWFQCDQVNQGFYRLQVVDISGNWRVWNWSLQAASTWQQVEVAIGSYESQSSTAPNLSAIQYIGVEVQTASTAPSEITLWMADIRAEVGYINHCEDTSAWSNGPFNSVGYTTIANDGAVFKNSYSGIGAAQLPSTATAETSALNAVKMSGISGSGGGLAGNFDLPVPPWDLSSYDFLVLWVRCDMGGNPAGAIQIAVGNGGSYFLWNYGSIFNANQWYRLVLPLRNPGSTVGTPSLTSIAAIQVGSIAAASAATNVWVDEIAVDVGKWVSLEFHVPDNVLQEGAGQALTGFDWYSGAYNKSFAMDATGTIQGGGTGYYHTLDGSAANALYGNYALSAYVPESIGTPLPQASFQWKANNAPLTYTTTYGCNFRFALLYKLPPASSDTIAGNYPSDDLSGFMALNKVRLKIEAYIANEDTSYAGF